MELHPIPEAKREALARNINQMRRDIWREFLTNLLSTFSDFEFSFPQIATLFMLEEEEEALTIKQVSEILGRSMSTTSRLLDALVERGLVNRSEDKQDRRIKRVSINDAGRKFLSIVARQRAEAQLTIMEYLSVEEQLVVMEAMELLAKAGRRRELDEHATSPIITSTESSDAR